MIHKLPDENLDRLHFAISALAIISAVAAAGVIFLSAAETVGYFSAGWPVGIPMGLGQLLLTVVTFTGPALTFISRRNFGMQICAIVLNVIIVCFGLTVGTESGGLIVEIVNHVVNPGT